MKRILMAALGLSVAGCATTTAPSAWVAVRHQDPFTDQVICRVSPPDEPLSVLYPMQFVYHPFVERRPDGVRVGLISGGRYKLPVGRVQLRVDDRPAWVIETSETPIDTPSPAAKADAQDSLSRFRADAVASVGQAVSPFTAATGDKAERMLAQMKTGHEVIYQTAAINQPGSSLGHQLLGAPFLNALANCGL